MGERDDMDPKIVFFLSGPRLSSHIWDRVEKVYLTMVDVCVWKNKYEERAEVDNGRVNEELMSCTLRRKGERLEEKRTSRERR